MDDVPPASVRRVSPFAGVPLGLNMANILLVGHDGVGKRTLAMGLKAAESAARRPLSVTIATAGRLPLTDGAEAVRADLVVLLCSFASLLSFDVLLKSLEHVSEELVLGRVCVLVSHADQRAAFAFSKEELLAETREFDLPVFMTNLKDAKMLESVAARIIELTATAMRLRGRFSHLLAKTIEYDAVTGTLLDLGIANESVSSSLAPSASAVRRTPGTGRALSRR